MKVTESWLREWCNPIDLSITAMAHAITMAGLEVDGIEYNDASLDGVVIGNIIRTEPHPDADKLKVTYVDIGRPEPIQIVCGAPNAREGLIVPVATIGATLPGDFTIKAAKLRGVNSSGMLCSAKELAIGEDSGGLLELTELGINSADVGKPLSQALDLNDPVVDIDLTPNRGDCLSLRGIAREIGVLTNTDCQSPTINPITPDIDDAITVNLAASDACPKYLGRVIKGIDTTVTTPRYIQNRLRQVGIRSHSLAVDITNYVMLALGQPMHSFDFDQLQGSLTVRQAEAGETLQLLNDKRVTLSSDTLIIADKAGPIAIAGIMGGARAETSTESSNIFLESAFFSPIAVAGKAREFGLQTDASHRFERGVALDIQQDALEWATRLILEAAGGQAGPITISQAADQIKPQSAIDLPASLIPERLGINIDSKRVIEIFKRLGFTVNPTEEGWQITPPAWRFDVAIAADLLEEIARIYGYEHIPSARPATLQPRPNISEQRRSGQALKQQLAQLGYAEIVAYSFIPEGRNTLFYGDRPEITLANPISQEMSAMRTSLLPGLLQTAQFNHSRSQKDCQLFDMGICFTRGKGDTLLPDEEAYLGGIATGQSPEYWQHDSFKVDFFEVKGDLDQLLRHSLNSDDQIIYETASIKGFQPGQCAAINLNGNQIGVVGKIHPNVAKSFGIKSEAFAFEIALAPLLNHRDLSYQAISKLPASRRDIAIVVDRTVSYQAILETIRDCDIAALETINIFDVYEDEKLGEHAKSLALGLSFQPEHSTLTDATVDSYIQIIIEKLNDRHQAQLRDA